MTKAELQKSLDYWLHELDIARYWLADARKDAKSGAGAATAGVVTDEEAHRIFKWANRVNKCEAMINRRRTQLGQGSGDKPRIITAEQIGLTFQNVFGTKGTIFRGAGHYTAGHRCSGATELIAEAKSDHRFHAGKGWGGLSYEVMVADDGTVLLGNPIWRKSAAVAVNNTGMVNICCPGTTGDNIAEKQRQSIEWLFDNWHTDAIPKAHRLPRSAGSLTWKGHKEWPSQSTACPGNMLDDYHRIWGDE